MEESLVSNNGRHVFYPLSSGRIINQYCLLKLHFDVLESSDMTFLNFCILSKNTVMNLFWILFAKCCRWNSPDSAVGLLLEPSVALFTPRKLETTWDDYRTSTVKCKSVRWYQKRMSAKSDNPDSPDGFDFLASSLKIGTIVDNLLIYTRQ